MFNRNFTSLAHIYSFLRVQKKLMKMAYPMQFFYHNDRVLVNGELWEMVLRHKGGQDVKVTVETKYEPKYEPSLKEVLILLRQL